MARGALPNLIVIGAGRCGTTSLHHHLSLHPQIAMSRTKELNFFADAAQPDPACPMPHPIDRRLADSRRGAWDRGVAWYRDQFDPAAAVRGEASPLYTAPWFAASADRMARLLPDARIIVCLRDPVERAVSHHRLARALGADPRPADQALSPDGMYAHTSRYAERLAPFLARFAPERILMIDRDDPAGAGAAPLPEVFRWLGVDERFDTPAFRRRWNVSARQKGVRWRALAALRRAPGWSVLATRVPRRALWLVERGTGGGRADALPGPSDATRARLAAALADDAARLRELTGRSFASWSV